MITDSMGNELLELTDPPKGSGQIWDGKVDCERDIAWIDYEDCSGGKAYFTAPQEKDACKWHHGMWHGCGCPAYWVTCSYPFVKKWCEKQGISIDDFDKQGVRPIKCEQGDEGYVKEDFGWKMTSEPLPVPPEVPLESVKPGAIFAGRDGIPDVVIIKTPYGLHMVSIANGHAQLCMNIHNKGMTQEELQKAFQRMWYKPCPEYKLTIMRVEEKADEAIDEE